MLPGWRAEAHRERAQRTLNGRENTMQRRTFLRGAAGIAALATATSPFLGRDVWAADKKVLRIAMNAEVLTLDPIKTVYGADILAQGIMFSRLRRADAERKELFPAL